MSDQVRDRVDELLADANTASGAALSPDGEGGGDGPPIGETAREASDLLESAEPGELLAAVGLDEFPDGTEPDTIPEAIARGDPEHVDELKRLLNLAKLADRTGDDLDEAADSLGSAIDAARDEEDGGETEETNETDESEGDETSIEGAEDDAEADETDSVEDDAAPDDGAESGDLEDRLRSAVSERVDDFGDDLSGLQERLEAAASATDDDASDDGEPDEEASDETDADAAADDEPESADAAADDDGLLEADLGSEGEEGVGSSDSSRYSTMAPPPNERADMHAVKRHRTMPKKN